MDYETRDVEPMDSWMRSTAKRIGPDNPARLRTFQFVPGFNLISVWFPPERMRLFANRIMRHGSVRWVES
jgi:hypothetical protein